MALSNRLISILKKALICSAVAILIVTLLELVFIGKNLTFTTKFTPPSSEQNRLRNQTYYTSAQALLIFISIINVFLLPLATFSAFKHTRTAFVPVLVSTLVVNALLLFLNMYFLTGASAYRSYMNHQYQEMRSRGVCEYDRISLCMVGNCVRLSIYQEAKAMSIAYTIIQTIFLTAFTIISILVNKKQKDSRKMQLIV